MVEKSGQKLYDSKRQTVSC